MDIYTVVHPIVAPNSWNVPDGWRWAIHIDDQFHQVDVGCLNAGWEASREEAEAMLSRVVITVRRALVAAGIESKVVASVLSDCPLTADIVAELAVMG